MDTREKPSTKRAVAIWLQRSKLSRFQLGARRFLLPASEAGEGAQILLLLLLAAAAAVCDGCDGGDGGSASADSQELLLLLLLVVAAIAEGEAEADGALLFM